MWQLPFNVIKHEFKLTTKDKYISKILGFYSNKTIYLKTIDDELFQINLTNLKLTKNNNQILMGNSGNNLGSQSPGIGSKQHTPTKKT